MTNMSKEHPELISKTELCARMGVSLTVERLLSIGAMPMQMLPQGVYFDANDYLEICELVGNFLLNGGADYEDK